MTIDICKHQLFEHRVKRLKLACLMHFGFRIGIAKALSIQKLIQSAHQYSMAIRFNPYMTDRKLLITTPRAVWTLVRENSLLDCLIIVLLHERRNQ